MVASELPQAELSYYLGIDPGKAGALALYKPQGCPDVIFYDMPLKSDPIKKGRKIIDLYALARWIDSHSRLIKHAIIEKPNAMPGQGVTSSFNFGFGCGVVQMAVAAHLIPMVLIRPAAWKKRLELSKDKEEVIGVAKNLIPSSIPKLFLKKHHGRAEALLLANLLYEDLRDGKISTD